MSKTTRAHVIRDFNNSGTGERFTEGKTVEIEAGEFANYEAAGLVRAVASHDTKAAPDAKAAPSDDGKGKPAA